MSSHSGPQLIFKYPQDLSGEEETPPDEVNTSDSDADESTDAMSILNEEVDLSNMNYYMGTKKDIIGFLDDQERSRQAQRQKINAIGRPQQRVEDRIAGSAITISLLTKNTSNPASSITNMLDSGTLEPPSSKSSIPNAIFGIETDYLCEMLAPPKQMCNTRFEIMIDEQVFVGLPIHKHDNGTWRQHESKKKKASTTGDAGNLTDSLVNGAGNAKRLNLNMFHLVFVMNPPIVECNYRIDEMFHYVISRLTMVLRYEQLKEDYVSEQVRLILSLKESLGPKTQSETLVAKSSLCRLIYECYDAISNSRIANLSINNKLRSFQIPIKSEFYLLPEESVPYLPGSSISSMTKLLATSGLICAGETSRYAQSDVFAPDLQTADEHGDDESSTLADQILHFAILLLDNADNIIRDIRTEENSILAKFIRMIRPTESLFRISARNPSLSANEIKSFSFHLVYWRRARIIQPLTSRSTYIISPMAPISENLYRDIKLFKKEFPSLPSLIHFMRLLSGSEKSFDATQMGKKRKLETLKPQQYGMIIPTKDHKKSYMEALAWLIRYGYATQLQTFLWLKISRKIKLKVEEDLENEALQRKKTGSSKKTAASKGTDNSSKIPDAHVSAGEGKVQTILKKRVTDDEIDEIEKRLKKTQLGPNIVLEDDDDTILIDPARATALERKWINKIIQDECHLSSELTAIFYKLLRYMNGNDSLELLLLKENISRSMLQRLLGEIKDHIIAVRHW